MKEVSKFIPIDGSGEETESGIGEENVGGYGVSTGNGSNNTTGTGTSTWARNTTAGTIGGTSTDGETTFRVCGNPSNLPAKQKGIFSKLKSVLFYEIKVELTPYQQKVEDEINDFLHQEITWKGFKDFLFQDVSFSKKNKTK